MTNDLSSRLAQRVKEKKYSHRGVQNRIAFLALREDIEQAINDGWSIKSIWEILSDEKKIGITYQSFARYVNRLILTVKTEAPSTSAIQQSHQTKQVSSETPSFIFNPHPNKDDLL